MEFKLKLADPMNCSLGVYLYQCRVKVIDNTSFPTDMYKELVTQRTEDDEDDATIIDKIESVGGFALFMEYWKMNYCVDGIAWRTQLQLFFDQLPNIYLYFKLTAMAYMLNDLFQDIGDPDVDSAEIASRERIARIIGVWYIVPMFVLQLWDILKIKLDTAGHSRVYLQKSLFRKFLNYSEKSRQAVDLSTIQIAIGTDAERIANGYMSILEGSKLVGKLAVILYFILNKNPDAIYTILIMPTLLAIFAGLRNQVLVRAEGESDAVETAVLSIVQDAQKNYRLVSNYNERPKMNDQFAKRASLLRVAATSPAYVKMNNNYFSKWLGPAATGIYIMFNASSVMTGSLKQGTFVATLSIFSEVSADFCEMYAHLMQINSIICTLRGITKLLNAPTDLKDWKFINRQRREATKEARDKVMAKRAQQDEPAAFLTDQIPLRFTNMGYSYPHGDWKLSPVNLEVPQGKLVAINGDHGHGRQTLLRLIGHELFPTEGQLFIPTHLRILHVSQEAYLLDSSVSTNLNFGCQEVDMPRVEWIMEQMRMNSLLDLMHAQETANSGCRHDSRLPSGSDDDDDTDDSSQQNCAPFCAEDEPHYLPEVSWLNKLTYTQRAKIHLARALLMNPEVMILQRPLLHFNTTEQRNFMQLLRWHVANRGLGLPAKSAPRRRPRTVFFSTEAAWQADFADVTLQTDLNEDGTHTFLTQVQQCST